MKPKLPATLIGYHQYIIFFGHAAACADVNRLAIILDLNNVLMITHRKSKDNLPPDLLLLYFYVLKVKEDWDITYYVRADAEVFILQASQLANVFIWSSCTISNLSRRTVTGASLKQKCA